ncbi:MAG: hypothetical protein IBJ13_08915 [Sphingopyxis sp.]|nr:hypothetical protein [Sphingopyxis sp.]
MRFGGHLIVAAAALGMAVPATAQSAQDSADARCVLAINMLMTRLGDKLSESDKSGFDSFVTYFLGKVRGRTSADLATLLPPPVVREVQNNLKTEMERCNSETGAISLALGQMSAALAATIAANNAGQ